MPEPFYPEHSPSRAWAYDFGGFHSALTCLVIVLEGPTALWVVCLPCRIASQLETVARKIDIDGSTFPREDAA